MLNMWYNNYHVVSENIGMLNKFDTWEKALDGL